MSLKEEEMLSRHDQLKFAHENHQLFPTHHPAVVGVLGHGDTGGLRQGGWCVAPDSGDAVQLIIVWRNGIDSRKIAEGNSSTTDFRVSDR